MMRTNPRGMTRMRSATKMIDSSSNRIRTRIGRGMDMSSQTMSSKMRGLTI